MTNQECERGCTDGPSRPHRAFVGEDSPPLVTLIIMQMERLKVETQNAYKRLGSICYLLEKITKKMTMDGH